MRKERYKEEAFKLNEFVNGRGVQPFTPAQLKDQLKVCGFENPDSFVNEWLKKRLKQNDILKEAHGIYWRKKPLLTKLGYIRRLCGLDKADNES
ncbi:hypothetical protein M5X06_22345 [Paenibacillus alvei]|uniref:Uncharacterized protein n=1 Tax=Paenibacillus alvei TaxID=44250 RepID=A0ABT4H3F7_PAEAL|nr:hypothetical protein [Paenibacillus alvei]MCY9763179.1 hypothetical protein [Paenibacillus alvei]MCY9769531.1 hypothetical protein [Paenibacillus alvei]